MTSRGLQLRGFMWEETEREQTIPVSELVKIVIKRNRTTAVLVVIVGERLESVGEERGKTLSVIIVVGESWSFEYQRVRVFIISFALANSTIPPV
jgi:hypothetical protein